MKPQILKFFLVIGFSQVGFSTYLPYAYLEYLKTREGHENIVELDVFNQLHIPFESPFDQVGTLIPEPFENPPDQNNEDLRVFLLDLFPEWKECEIKPDNSSAKKSEKILKKKRKIPSSSQSVKKKSKNLDSTQKLRILEVFSDAVVGKAYFRSHLQRSTAEELSVPKGKIDCWCRSFKNNFSKSGLSSIIDDLSKTDMGFFCYIDPKDFPLLFSVLLFERLLTEREIHEFASVMNVDPNIFGSWYFDKMSSNLN